MREKRLTYREITPEARARSNARAYLRVYLRRGKITKGPCAVCGTSLNVQGHHEDYAKPLDVVWLCQVCHGKADAE